MTQTSDRTDQKAAETTDGATTHFGFRDVDEAEKAGLVQGVFSSVASRYDIMNDVMSGGVHRLWKDAMMDWLSPRDDQRLLDVAGGTGDIAFRFLKRAPGAEATVLDLTEEMLTEGRARAEAERLEDQLTWIAGDAMALPFEDGTFDAYTNSFGIRKVTRIEDALREAYRVLKPGGRLIYATCSILPAENDDRVDAFLARRSGFAVLPADALWRGLTDKPAPPGLTARFRATPARDGADGFYCAVLERALNDAAA